MTLPEIPKEENEKPITKCQFCGKEGASKAHERFCSKNPNNPRSKKKTAMKQETPSITSSNPKTPAEPATHNIKISDVQPYTGDIMAWFQDENGMFSRTVEFVGTIDNMPSVLVMLENGTFVPPYTITGFIGMFPENMKFALDKQDDEPFPPFEVEEEKEAPKTLLEKIEENHPDIKEVMKTETTKKSWWPFSHKKPACPKTPIENKDELKDLVEGAINATG